MKKTILSITSLSVLALAGSVQAGPVGATASSTTAWSSGTIAFETGAAPTTGSGGTSQDNDNWGATGAPGSGSGAFGSLAETFTVSTAGTLNSVQVVMAGSSETFDINLYDLGSVASFNAGTAGVYPIVPAQLNFGDDLLNTSDQFAYAANTGQNLYTLSLGSEGINLQTGEVYAFTLDPTDSSASSVWWVRGGTPNASYGNGEGWNTDSASYGFAYQNFEGKAGPYSSGGRSFDMAVTVSPIPEPTSLALLGMGALAGAMVIRRRNR